MSLSAITAHPIKQLITLFALLTTLEGTCQLQCKDVKLEPNPYELLNDSITNLATSELIQDLIEEQNLLFSYKFNLRTREITRLQMDYFEAGLLNGEEPLDPELIKKLEALFERNLKVIIEPQHADVEQDQIIECAFLTRIITE